MPERRDPARRQQRPHPRPHGGDSELALRRAIGALRTGSTALDRLLGGGVRPGPPHLFFGDRRPVARLLLHAAVVAQAPPSRGGLNAPRVVYVDAENWFDPYAAAYLAAANRLDPRRVLDGVSLARAFNWDQTVEMLASRLDELPPAGLVLVAGVTSSFPKEPNRSTWVDVGRALAGLRRFAAKCARRIGREPAVVLSTRAHPHSHFRPLGGKQLAHFAGVVVRVRETARRVEYALLHHPGRPATRAVEWSPAPRSANDAAAVEVRRRVVPLDRYLGRRDRADARGRRRRGPWERVPAQYAGGASSPRQLGGGGD
ncbi:MAG: hypothetical protein Kow0069_29390 [Promethearchaeota archaeon]